MELLDKIKQIDINVSKKIPIDTDTTELSEFYTKLGYNDYIFQIIINDNTRKLIDTLPKITNTNYIYENSNNLEKYTSKSKLFLTNLFTIHDVLYLKKYKLKKGSPFSIKINLSNEEPLTGYLSKQTIVNDNNQYNNVFLNIELSKKITSFTSLIYTHEIVHTQLESINGSIKNLFNVEILPIFLELLYAYNSDMYLFRAILANRISDINDYSKNIITNNTFNQDEYENSTFYVSILTALKLLNIYINGSKKIKKEILLNIQNVFNGNNTLEESLKVYELDWTHNM